MRGKHHDRIALALLLGMCMALSLCLPAGAVDLAEPCSVRVEVSEEIWEDLQTANVVVDLYQIASAVPAGEDGFTYSVLPPFAEPEPGTEMDSSAWQAFAQDAAEIALAEGAPVVTGAEIGVDITVTDSGTALGPGLYLLIARGADLADYSMTATMEDGEELLVTMAYTEDYEYFFAPEIVNVPVSRTEDGEETEEESGVWPPRIEGAGVRVWVYNLKVALKMARVARYGSIEIKKSLLTYETSEPATFVFDVKAELDGAVVYSNVTAMTFTSAGELSVLVDRIPVGAEVTVREVYSGTHYYTVSGATATAVVSASEIVGVSFENEYTETPNGGHGIINQFTYDGETWQWVQTDGTDDQGARG